MTTTIVSNIAQVPPIMPKSYGPNRKLLSIYKQKGVSYEINLYSSHCKEICYLSNAELGIVTFDRASETFISGTKEISEHYLSYLKRTLKILKKNYP